MNELKLYCFFTLWGDHIMGVITSWSNGSQL